MCVDIQNASSLGLCLFGKSIANLPHEDRVPCGSRTARSRKACCSGSTAEGLTASTVGTVGYLVMSDGCSPCGCRVTNFNSRYTLCFNRDSLPKVFASKKGDLLFQGQCMENVLNVRIHDVCLERNNSVKEADKYDNEATGARQISVQKGIPDAISHVQFLPVIARNLYMNTIETWIARPLGPHLRDIPSCGVHNMYTIGCWDTIQLAWG